MKISVEECHFGYFALDHLKITCTILNQIRYEPLEYDSAGNIVNHVSERPVCRARENR